MQINRIKAKPMHTPFKKKQQSHGIHHVVIYSGHQHHPAFGPYGENIQKRIQMFQHINQMRQKMGQNPWSITPVRGEMLRDTLRSLPKKKTLLVIPAGQSSNLDRVFCDKQTEFLKNQFVEKGGRIYVNCGSAYWASKLRIYDDVCLEQPTQPKTLMKPSNMELFEGTAIGPLCKFPAPHYKVGFFSDAIDIKAQKEQCTIFLSGGGSFVLPKKSSQKIKVLVKYSHRELERHGVQPQDFERWENATIMTQVGEGAALLSMYHPYYGPQDIDVERYEKAFPDSGTDWRRVHNRLTPLEERMHFVYHRVLSHLDQMNFDQ